MNPDTFQEAHSCQPVLEPQQPETISISETADGSILARQRSWQQRRQPLRQLKRRVWHLEQILSCSGTPHVAVRVVKSC